MSILALTFRFALAIVLGVAAFAKARSFDDFTRMVEAIVPRRRGVSVVAAGVVAIEAALAVLLAAGVMPSVAAAATLVLVFAAISVWAARHGLHVQCFGRSGRELGKEASRRPRFSPWRGSPTSGTSRARSCFKAGCWQGTGVVGEHALRLVADVLATELHPLR